MLRKKWSHSKQISKLKFAAPCLKDVTQSNEQEVTCWRTRLLEQSFPPVNLLPQ